MCMICLVYQVVVYFIDDGFDNKYGVIYFLVVDEDEDELFVVFLNQNGNGFI